MERRSEIKHDYLRGRLCAMAGANRQHNLVVTNVISELRNHLKRKPCEVHPSDMRVRLRETDMYACSDAVVVCQPPAFEIDGVTR